jgi:hypothetical protein
MCSFSGTRRELQRIRNADHHLAAALHPARHAVRGAAFGLPPGREEADMNRIIYLVGLIVDQVYKEIQAMFSWLQRR